MILMYSISILLLVLHTQILYKTIVPLLLHYRSAVFLSIVLSFIKLDYLLLMIIVIAWKFFRKVITFEMALL